METSKRFNQALEKLYNAFHENRLNPLSCTQCAVGTILDNNHYWKEFSNYNGTLQLNYVGLVHQRLGRKFNGFTPLELLQIEKVFLQACGYAVPLHQYTFTNKKKNKDKLFKGLEAVVAQLCTFDNIPNVMDCTSLFNHQRQTPKNTKRDFFTTEEVGSLPIT
jgi:hypothetical protein